MGSFLVITTGSSLLSYALFIPTNISVCAETVFSWWKKSQNKSGCISCSYL